MKTNQAIFAYASFPGLVLGAVCISYELLNLLCGGITRPLLAGTVGVLLWLLKTGGCLYLLFFFLRRYAETGEGGGFQPVYRCGLAISFLSALVYSGFYFAYTMYIVPDLFDKALDLFISTYSSALSADSLDTLENIRPDLPLISFVSKLIYCFVFGAVLSAVYARRIAVRNPFNEPTSDEQ
ncbi:MAG: DUF4199 domain-containing protein [Bacteroidales bacterium]|nr:DUF4199 domain-containing protein [Bacteroidales bacterium]